MKNVRTPRFLENLYRDLRNRRLLLPAIALVVALLAVPILLKDDPPASTSTPSATGPNASDSAAAPAVVTQELGVTNYRKRLARLQKKNPFHQQYTATPESGAVQVTPSGTSSSAASTSVGAGTTSTSTSTGSSTLSAPPSTGTSPSISSGSPNTTSSSPPQATRTPKPTVRLYAWRASVKVGEPSKLQERPEVQRLAMLPTEGKPVVTFMGASEDGDQALFLVSRDVDSVKGDGRCVPNHSSCQYLVMKPGDKANFHYAPNGKRYNLVLVDVHAVEVDDKLRKRVTGDAQPQAKMHLLGPG